jgi:hypothetical protein
MDERELKLNSLSRYSKSSPMYVLEEYGHCEIPAGCGGVVLRWRNPREGVPLEMSLYRNGDGEVYLDGEPPSSSMPLVSFGEHVLAFEVSVPDAVYMVLAFAARFPPSFSLADRRGPEEPQVSVLSTADGTWRFTTREPVDDTWKRSGFDDSSWSPMVANEERQPPEDPRRDMAKYRFEAVRRLGGAGLGIPEPATRIWIRKTFELRGGGEDD